MMTLNGMFSEQSKFTSTPKIKPHRINFIKENKKKLKQTSSVANQNVRCLKGTSAKSQSSQTEVDKGEPQGSSSKFVSNPTCSSRPDGKSSVTVFMREGKMTDVSSSTALSPPKKSSHRSVTVVRHQSCQTIDPKNYDQLFHEGILLYPSTKVLQEIAEAEKQKANRLDAHIKKDFFRKNRLKNTGPSKPAAKTNSDVNEAGTIAKVTKSDEEENLVPESRGPLKAKEGDANFSGKGRSFSELNAAEIIRKTTEEHLHYSPRNGRAMRAVPMNRGDSSFAHIPKIIKKCSGNRAKAEDEMLKTVLDPMCPPGHIPLPDRERKKTLHMLRVSYAELVREMNLLPVRTDTLRIRQRKIQLETQLNKIEEGIKVFNKSKVYVKIEE